MNYVRGWMFGHVLDVRLRKQYEHMHVQEGW